MALDELGEAVAGAKLCCASASNRSDVQCECCIGLQLKLIGNWLNCLAGDSIRRGRGGAVRSVIRIRRGSVDDLALEAAQFVRKLWRIRRVAEMSVRWHAAWRHQSPARRVRTLDVESLGLVRHSTGGSSMCMALASRRTLSISRSR